MALVVGMQQTFGTRVYLNTYMYLPIRTFLAAFEGALADVGAAVA
jgi:hypothetical protein